MDKNFLIELLSKISDELLDKRVQSYDEDEMVDSYYVVLHSSTEAQEKIDAIIKILEMSN